MPIAKRGSPGVPSEYESDACIAWYVARECKKIRDESPSDRLSRVKADAIEMDNAVRRKLLIPADLLEPKLRAAMVLAREAWMGEPAKIAHASEGKTVAEKEELLEQAFGAFLTRIANWRNADVLTDEDGANV
jgi:phage terminase Nu1 subunit (DNA packaging protein)